jgi:hypothetical protein
MLGEHKVRPYMVNTCLTANEYKKVRRNLSTTQISGFGSTGFPARAGY